MTSPGLYGQPMFRWPFLLIRIVRCWRLSALRPRRRNSRTPSIVGVCAGASSVGFQSDARGLPALTEVGQDRGRVGLPVQRAHEAAERRLDGVEAASESLFGEECRQHAAL